MAYKGSNTAYARINGKQTVRVAQTEGALVLIQLYDQFGFPFRDEITGGSVTYERPDIALREVEITPAPNKEDWFVHSVRVESIEEALSYGISPKCFERQRIVGVSDENGEHIGQYVSVGVEDKTAHPNLQSIYCVWPNYKAMQQDYEQHGLPLPG